MEDGECVENGQFDGNRFEGQFLDYKRQYSNNLADDEPCKYFFFFSVAQCGDCTDDERQVVIYTSRKADTVVWSQWQSIMGVLQIMLMQVSYLPLTFFFTFFGFYDFFQFAMNEVYEKNMPPGIKSHQLYINSMEKNKMFDFFMER